MLVRQLQELSFLRAVRRAKADAKTKPLQVAGVFRANHAEAAAVFAFEKNEAAVDVRRQFFAAARADDVADSRHIVDAVQRFEQDSLFLNKIFSVVRVQSFEFRLIETHEFFDAFAPPDVAKFEAICRAVNLFEAEATETAKRVHKAIFCAADDAGHIDGDSPAWETKEPRLFMAAAFTDNGRRRFKSKKRNVMDMDAAAMLAVQCQRANVSDDHGSSPLFPLSACMNIIRGA